MIKGAIFDMDGVLVDNSPVHLEAFQIMAARYGIIIPDGRFSSLFGRGNADIIGAVFPPEMVERYGVEALAKEKEAVYREIYAPAIKPVDGLEKFLETLHKARIACAVGSSGPAANVEFVLSKCGIEKYFDVRISGDMVTRCKPDPEIFLTAAARLGLAPSRCVVFEDAVAGITAARSAGAKVVALTTSLTKQEIESETEPDLIVKDFTLLSAEKVLSL